MQKQKEEDINFMEENITFKNIPSLSHEKIEVHFSKNSNDFVVREQALYEFSGNGEHLIIHICKKDLSTVEALRILSEFSGVKLKDFGYAGLKDKQGLTFQYISLPRKFEQNLNNFSHEKLKILNKFYHTNKIKIGHLKGNSFFIRLKKVNKINALKIKQAFETINKQGFANYFGYQRFGKFNDNYKQGIEILQGKINIKNKKINNFLLSSFQSILFNAYLSKRLELCHFVNTFNKKEFASIFKLGKDEVNEIYKQEHFFKLLKGDVLCHYPFGRNFFCEDVERESARFFTRDINITGLLLGKNAMKNKDFALVLEDEIFTPYYVFNPSLNGSRRFLWSYLEEANLSYDEEKAQLCLEFFLQKGSYATTVLEEILH